MSKIYIIGKPQSQTSCRLNSAAMGAYLIAFPGEFIAIQSNAATTAIKAYIDMKNKLALAIAIINPQPPAPPIINIPNWFDKTEVEHFIKAMKSTQDDNIKSIISQIFEIKIIEPEDAFIAAYKDIFTDLNIKFQAMNQEIASNNVYQQCSNIINAADSIKAEDTGVNEKVGLYAGQANEKFQTKNAFTDLMTFIEDGSALSLRAGETFADGQNIEAYLKQHLFDKKNNTLIQVTFAGHSISFAKINGQYCKFDSLGSAGVDETDKYATLTIYQNENELTDDLKTMYSKKRGGIEFANVDFKIRERIEATEDNSEAMIQQEQLIKFSGWYFSNCVGSTHNDTREIACYITNIEALHKMNMENPKERETIKQYWAALDNLIRQKQTADFGTLATRFIGEVFNSAGTTTGCIAKWNQIKSSNISSNSNTASKEPKGPSRAKHD
jgi:hypothetical protein